MTEIKNLNISEINKGKAHFAELIKILFFKKNEGLISLLDIDNDEIFLDSFIYSYFNDAEAETKVTLEQLVYGYISDEHKPKTIEIIFDEDCIAYLPKIGYFKAIDKSLKKQRCVFKHNNGDFKIEYNNVLVKTTFLPLIFADNDNKVEVIQFQHPLLKDFFQILRPDYSNQGAQCIVEVNSITNFHLNNLRKAFVFIQKHFPTIYETILASNKYVMVFGNQAMLPFAAQNSLGISYISSLYNDSYLFFVEEMLHQGSHNLFFYMHYDKFKYFKVDAENSLLGDYLNNPNEKRTIYNVFHGVITITQRLICYEYIIKNKLLSGLDLHELIGRYCDQYRRHHAGLELLNLDDVYTNEGKKLYLEMDNLCKNALTYFKDEAIKYNVINQPSEFNFQQYLVLNPYNNN
jgi:hypothetical protein